MWKYSVSFSHLYFSIVLLDILLLLLTYIWYYCQISKNKLFSVDSWTCSGQTTRCSSIISRTFGYNDENGIQFGIVFNLGGQPSYLWHINIAQQFVWILNWRRRKMLMNVLTFLRIKRFMLDEKHIKNLPYFWNMKAHIIIFVFYFLLIFLLINATYSIY